MSKMSVPFWRETAKFAPGLCAMVATLGLVSVTNAGDDPACPNPNGGDCFTETLGEPGCADATCCNIVCDIDDFCCLVEWDENCAAIAAANCSQPCDGTQTAYSNVTTFTGFGFGSDAGNIDADDIFPESGGLVAEISFSLVNLDLGTAQNPIPTENLIDGTVTIVLLNGTGSFTAPVYPDDVIAEIEVELTGLFDQGEPLEPGDGVVLTVEFTPEDALFIPPGFLWAGLRIEDAVWETTTPPQDTEHLGQLLVGPVDVGASNDVFWRQGTGLLFFGGNPVANFGWEFVVACGPGACCFPETGDCDDSLDQDGCEAAGGLFAGAGFTCEDVTCPVIGACCLVSGECVDGLFEGECENEFGGTWQGPLSTCLDAECPDPCTLGAVAGGTAEGEPCGQALNEGCNSETQSEFGAIACGETVNGTAWADGGTRDTDWYLIDVPAVDGSGMTRVNVTLSSQFPADTFMLDVTDCDAITFPDPDNNGVNAAADCQEHSFSVCVEVGQYAIFVGAAVPGGAIFDGVPCGSGANNYSLSVECVPCDDVGGCPQDCVTSATFQPPPDGVVDGADLAVLLGDWGACPGCCSDTVTSATFQPPPDGTVDGADLAVLLGAWGDPGCPQ